MIRSLSGNGLSTGLLRSAATEVPGWTGIVRRPDLMWNIFKAEGDFYDEGYIYL